MSDVLFGMHPQQPQRPSGSVPAHPPPLTATGQADGTGVATIRLPAVPGDQVWVLERINIGANSATQPTLAMWDRDPAAAGAMLLGGSTTGNDDVDDASTLVLFPGDQLTFVWAGCTPGAVCRCRVQYRLEAAG